MYDMETYEQMRSLANFKFGLQLMNVYLPSQTIDQGSFDVLNIIKNIQSFVNRYTYNMYTQTFSQVLEFHTNQKITTDSKQIYSIGIS
jgi:WASH complex subunit 7